jgi:hypothetical protein
MQQVAKPSAQEAAARALRAIARTKECESAIAQEDGVQV